MINRCLGVVAVSLICSIQSSDATVLERDWKNRGDGLLVFDDVNNREWLDLTVTQGMSLAAVSSQLGRGEMFEAFSTASIMDLEDLVMSAEIDTSTVAFDVNKGPASSLIDLLGATIVYPVSSMGVTSTTIGPTWNLIGIVHVIPPVAAGLDSIFTGADVDVGDPERGVWLFRSVPEPSSSLLLGLGSAFVLCCVRRCRTTH